MDARLLQVAIVTMVTLSFGCRHDAAPEVRHWDGDPRHLQALLRDADSLTVENCPPSFEQTFEGGIVGKSIVGHEALDRLADMAVARKIQDMNGQVISESMMLSMVAKRNGATLSRLTMCPGSTIVQVGDASYLIDVDMPMFLTAIDLLQAKTPIESPE